MPIMCAANNRKNNGDSCNHSVITGSGKKETIQQPKGPLPEILNDQREEESGVWGSGDAVSRSEGKTALVTNIVAHSPHSYSLLEVGKLRATLNTLNRFSFNA